MRSTERSGRTDIDRLCAPEMIEVNARILTGVSAFGKFFAARKKYHDDPRAARDPANTAKASPMRFLVAARTNPIPEFGLLLCVAAPSQRVHRRHEFALAAFHEIANARLIDCADNDDRSPL